MDETVFIGIDIGTTSVKVSVVKDEGIELVSRTEDTNAEVKSDISDSEDRFDQCPLRILKVVESAFESATSACHCTPAQIKGIGVSGQMHGIVLWKKGGAKRGTQPSENEDKTQEQCEKKMLMDHALGSNPSHLYTWQDQRCSPSFLATLPKPSNTKLPLSTGHGCATLFWLSRTNEDTTLEKGQYDCCGTIIDYFVYLLCGLKHPVTSDQLAASLGYFNQGTGDWDSVLADTPEFPRHMMPTVVNATTHAGVVQPFQSSIWPSGVPVLVGMGDVQCAMAALIKHPTQAAVNISTSIQLGLPVPSQRIPDMERQSPLSISFFPYFGQEHLALCAGLNGGNAIKYFVECVGNWMRQLGFDEDSCATSVLFSRLQRLAFDSEDVSRHDPPTRTTLPSPLPSDLTVRPTFYGERHDPSLCGAISNISLNNFQNIGHVFRCVCEGVVNHLSTMVPPSFLKSIGIQELLVCGSVPERNPFVKSALERIYAEGGISVNLGSSDDSSNKVSSAVGAARIAMNALYKI